MGTAPNLALIVQSHRTLEANYAESNPLHVVTTASSPSGVATVTGAGTYSNGETVTFSAPNIVTNAPFVYTFQRFRLNGSLFGGNATFDKTFSTLDPAAMNFVAEYSTRSIRPLIVQAGASSPNPVPALTNLEVRLQFDRTMQASAEPLVVLSNIHTGLAFTWPTNGLQWEKTVVSNDTYRTLPLALTPERDGTNDLWVANAGDLNGLLMETTNALRLVIDASAPPHPLLSVVSSNSSSVRVSWAGYPAPSDIDGFRVFLEGTSFSTTAGVAPLTRLNGAAREFLFSNLQLDTDYYAAMGAVDRAGNSDPNVTPLRFRLDSMVPPPVAVQVSPSGANSARVDWSGYNTSGLFGFAGFRVYISEVPASSVAVMTLLEELGPGVQSTSVAGLDRAKAYFIAVTAFNRLGQFNPNVDPGTWSDPYAGELRNSLTLGGPGQEVVDVFDDMTLLNDATLTVAPGTTVRFSPGKGLRVVQGRLLARGTALRPIFFTALSAEGGAPPAPGAWTGVRLESGASGSQLDHLFIDYGGGLTVDGAAPVIEALTVRNNLLDFTWDIRTLSRQVHRVKLLARDRSGNVATLERSVVIDPIPPAPPVINSPESGAVLTSGLISVSGMAEPGIQVSVTRNSLAVGMAQANALGLFTITDIPLVEGANRLVAIATDSTGSSASGTVMVELDSGAPGPLIFEAPVYRPGLGLLLTWGYTPDAEQPALFQLHWHTAPFASTNEASGRTILLDEPRYEVRGLADGDYYFRLIGFDRAGNSSPLSDRIQVRYDATAPLFNIAFGKASPVGAGPVPVILSASEALDGIPSLVFQDANRAATVSITLSNSSVNVFQGALDVLPSMASGPGSFRAGGRDLAGNSGVGALADPQLVIDVRPPHGLLTISPSGLVQTLSPTNLSVNLRLDEASAPELVPELVFLPPAGDPVPAILNGEGTNWLGIVTLTPDMGSGSGQFRMAAADALGNTGTNLSGDIGVELYNTAVPNAPPPPKELRAATVPGGGIRLTWLASTQAESYRVYSEEGITLDLPTVLVEDNVPGLSRTNTPPADGSYRFSVTAIRRGAESPPSNLAFAVSDRTPPDAPVNVLAEVTQNGVRVAWDPAPTGEFPQRYRVYRNDEAIRTVTSATPVTDAPPRGIMEYAVSALDAFGNESRSEPVTVELLVGAVNNARVLVAAGQAPVLSWTRDDPTATGVHVYRNGIRQTSTPLTDSQYADLLPRGNASVEYTLRAVNADGNESAPRLLRVLPVRLAMTMNTAQTGNPRPLITRYFNQYAVTVSNADGQAVLGLDQLELHRRFLNSDGTPNPATQQTIVHALDLSVPAGGSMTSDVIFPSAAEPLAQSMRVRAIQLADLAGSQVLYEEILRRGTCYRRSHQRGCDAGDGGCDGGGDAETHRGNLNQNDRFWNQPYHIEIEASH